jgi:hypothetical protein
MAPSPSSKKRNHAFGAGDLLGNILNETDEEAKREEERLRAELEAKRSREQAEIEAEKERKRQEAQQSMEEEARRRFEAAEKRARVLRDLAGEVETDEDEDEDDVSTQASGEFAANVFVTRTTSSYTHQAVPESRSPWLVGALAAALVLVLMGGAVFYFVVLSGPEIDLTSYPKATVSYQIPTGGALTHISLNMVPIPEPETPPTGVIGEEGIADASSGSDSRRGDRDHRRHRDDDEEEEETPTPPVELDAGRDIFGAGGE